jgi:hypothetical protein
LHRGSAKDGSATVFKAEARSAPRKDFLIKKYFDLCELGGHEKKFKNDENAKINLNEIEYLQVLIFAKIDFFSCPASLR